MSDSPDGSLSEAQLSGTLSQRVPESHAAHHQPSPGLSHPPQRGGYSKSSKNVNARQDDEVTTRERFMRDIYR